MAVVQGLEEAVVGTTRPDLTFIFDIAPEVGLQRAAERKKAGENTEGKSGGHDRFESMNLAFHYSLRDEFLAIAKAEPERCVVIDAAESRDRIAEQIWTAVRERFKL
jgi:dTMP kinase